MIFESISTKVIDDHKATDKHCADIKKDGHDATDAISEPSSNYMTSGDESSIEDESTKFYKNPALQLKVKNTKKKTSQTKAGNYSGFDPSPKNKKTIKESSEVDKEILKKAEYANKLLSKEIVACKDCAYMYEKIMLPYCKDNSFAIIGWNLNKAKNNDREIFKRCRSAVFSYCSKIFNDINKGYLLNMDDSCFYIEKIN